MAREHVLFLLLVLKRASVNSEVSCHARGGPPLRPIVTEAKWNHWLPAHRQPSDCDRERSLQNTCIAKSDTGNEGLDYSVANRKKPYFILGRYA
ncbi:hypothetical protein NDU88_003105 [Pleurodeles waltl]|uniref:Secreted protein n=1 Tax=Pleurodeles waltl TaxID=8319 RepID=A0AAV7TN55_PLEWA|nr:hypothetical protein NDU88_003105 [Pleurodeles waltl]